MILYYNIKFVRTGESTGVEASSKDVLKDVFHSRRFWKIQHNSQNNCFFFKYIREIFRKKKTYLKFQCGSLLEFNGRVPLAHVHTHRPVLRVFPLDHQSENFILN